MTMTPYPPTKNPEDMEESLCCSVRIWTLKLKSLYTAKTEWLSLRCSHHFPSANAMCTCHVETQREMQKNDDNFQSCLEQIEEVLSIYQKTHIVLLVGDFNASLSRQRGNAQDVLLQAAVASNSLEHQQKGVSTFFHPNKTDSAEIDYIIFNKIGQRFVKSVYVEKSVALNTSDHVPVIMQMELPVGTGKMKTLS